MDGDEVIKLIGTTKIASDDDGTNQTYVNMTEEGATLNLNGKENVVVNAGVYLDIRAGTTVDIAATDTVALTAQEVILNPGSEFIVNSDMRARGKVTVVDEGASLIIHGANDDGITLENTIADHDIIFKVNHNVTSTEVLRLKGADASLRMKGLSPVEFRNSTNAISATEDNELTVKSSTIKLDASGDGSGTMDLTTVGSEKRIKIIGETKIASADNIGTYINATESGAYLNVVATDKVDIAATDSVELTALNVVITSGNEFTVDSDFKARGKVTIVDGSDSLSIHGDHAEGVTIKNEFEDRDIIFEIETGEVMRLVDNDGNANEALRLNAYNHLEFGQTDLSIKANSESQLAIRNNLDDGEILFKVSEDQVLKLNGDADGAHSVEIDVTTVDIDAVTTDVSGDLLVGDTLKVGAGDNILTVSQANGDVFVNNNALNKDVVFNVTRSGTDEAMRIDGQDLFLNVTNKIKVTNDASADPVAGSELQFINTGLPANTDVTDLYPLATISAQADNIVSSQILMEDATVVGGNQGVVSFDVMVDGQLVTLMEMNTPSREDAANYDSTITIPHNMDVIGDLYTNTMEFAERIVPDDPGGAEIGSTLLPWGDLYLYDGNGIGADASASSAHIYFKNENEEDADVEISHQPGDGIRIKGEKQIQFNSANTYISGSGTNPNEILNLVAPNLTMKHSTADTTVEVKV